MSVFMDEGGGISEGSLAVSCTFLVGWGGRGSDKFLHAPIPQPGTHLF